MIPDDNWKETRILAEDISKLLGIPTQSTEDYLCVLENLIIHRLIELVNDSTDVTNKDYSVELPYLGTLIVSVSDSNKLTTSFVCRSSFNKKIKSAIFQKKNPLISQISKILGDVLVSKMEDGEIHE